MRHHHCPACIDVPDHQATTVGDVRVLPHHAEHAPQVLAIERGARLAAATSTGMHPAPMTATAAGVPASTGPTGSEQPAAFHDGDMFVLALAEPAGELAWRRVRHPHHRRRGDPPVLVRQPHPAAVHPGPPVHHVPPAARRLAALAAAVGPAAVVMAAAERGSVPTARRRVREGRNWNGGRIPVGSPAAAWIPIPGRGGTDAGIGGPGSRPVELLIYLITEKDTDASPLPQPRPARAGQR